MRLFYLIIVLALLMCLVVVVTNLQDSETKRLYARAHLVEAKSDARTDLLAAMLPYVVIVSVGLFGVVAVVATVYGLTLLGIAYVNRPPAPQQHYFERQVVLVLKPGQTKAEGWRELSFVRELQSISNDYDI